MDKREYRVGIEVTDEQWDLIAPHLSEYATSGKGGQKPADKRACFEAVLWMARSGARWKDLPRYLLPAQSGAGSTGGRKMILSRKHGENSLPPSTKAAFCVGMSASPTGRFSLQKRGKHVGKTKRGKGTKLMVVADGEGVPLGVLTDSASPHEVTLIEKTIDAICLPEKQPERIVYDRAADSDKLRDAFERRNIELICPHRKNRKKAKRQDGRKLRRYARRWKMERTIGWLHNFRRIVVRYESNIMMYLYT